MECSDLFDSIDYFSERIGKRLCPIGECANGDGFAIVVAEDGAVYAVFLDGIRGIGWTVRDAIDCLISGTRKSDLHAQESLEKIDLPP